MILTCPECATSYYVDDGRIPPGGRTVRCSSCSARWHTGAAEAEAAPAPQPEPESVAEPEAPVEAEAEGGSEPAVATVDPADDLEISGPDLRRGRRAAASSSKGPAKARPGLATIAWAAVAAVVVALLGAAILLRGPVVRLLPQSAKAYAAVGLQVNSLGLVFEGVRADTVFQGGRPVLSVTGAIRNVADHATEAPPLRIDLLNKAGKPVAAKVARPIDPRIPAGARRHFAITIVDPPSTAHDLQVAFEAAAKGDAAHAAEAVLAPVPAEAQPLPPSAPDALPDHG